MAVDWMSGPTTQKGGNLFAALGCDQEAAAQLQIDSSCILSEKHAIKEKLMEEISLWINHQNLKQAEAALILGVTRPRVSDVINKKTPKFTVDALIDMLTRIGKNIQLSVR